MIITVRQPSELQRGGVRLALWAASVVVSFDCPVLPGRDDHADGDADDDSDCGDYNDTDPQHRNEIDHDKLLSPSIVQFCLMIAMLMTIPIY